MSTNLKLWLAFLILALLTQYSGVFWVPAIIVLLVALFTS